MAQDEKKAQDGKLAGRGGPGRGGGRKKLDESGSVMLNMRLTREQKAKVLSLGGSSWVRQQIDRARM